MIKITEDERYMNEISKVVKLAPMWLHGACNIKQELFNKLTQLDEKPYDPWGMAYSIMPQLEEANRPSRVSNIMDISAPEHLDFIQVRTEYGVKHVTLAPMYYHRINIWTPSTYLTLTNINLSPSTLIEVPLAGPWIVSFAGLGWGWIGARQLSEREPDLDVVMGMCMGETLYTNDSTLYTGRERSTDMFK